MRTCLSGLEFKDWYYLRWGDWNLLSWDSCCSTAPVISGLISSCDYLELVTFYSSARIDLETVSDYLFNAVYLIVALQAIQPEVDLVNRYWSSYLDNMYMKDAEGLLPAVAALEQHVLNRGEYDSIDEYFSDTRIAVPQSWSELSQEAGYTISDEWVEE